MPGAMHVQPLGGGFLATTDLVAHVRIENLSSTSSDRTKPGFTKNFQRLADCRLEDSLSQMAGFDCCECLYMQLRIKRAQSFQEIQIPLLFQSRMQSANHVNLSDTERERIRHGLNNFLDCVFECVRVAFLGGKRAELAG